MGLGVERGRLGRFVLLVVRVVFFRVEILLYVRVVFVRDFLWLVVCDY